MDDGIDTWTFETIRIIYSAVKLNTLPEIGEHGL